jgi:hypothetical protein
MQYPVNPCHVQIVNMYIYICTYGPWSFCNSQRWRNPRVFLGYLGFKTQNHPNDQTKAISFWVLSRHSQPSPSSKGTKFCSQLFLETRYQVLLHSSWAACYFFWAGWVFTIGTQKPLQYESYVKKGMYIYMYIKIYILCVCMYICMYVFMYVLM